MIQLAIYDGPGGQLLADYTHKATGARVSTSVRGYADCAAQIPMALAEAFIWHDRPGLPHVELTDNGLTVYEGRLEDPGLSGDGLSIAALGYSRALSDIPYIAFWSKTTVDQFVPVRTEDLASHSEAKWIMDTNGRVYLAPKKNETYANATEVGALTWIVPDKSGVAIVGMQFDFECKLPTNWIARMDTRDRAFGNLNTRWTLTGNGAVQTGAIHVTFASWERIDFAIFNNTGGAVTYLGESGANYLKITNPRVVGATTNRVNTSLTANIAAGAGVSAPVGSTARMYVGQRLIIAGAGGPGVSESVVVTAITDATHFTATFALAHLNTQSVQGFVIYADEIVGDIAAAIAAVNASQLSTATALIQSPGLDLTDEIYEDRYGADILDELANRGDNQTTPRRWEWGVWDDRRLAFQPRGSGRTWYVDVTNLEVIRTLADLANSVYATYDDASAGTLRTATNADAFSVTKYGVTRRQAASASTTVVQQAQVTRDATLADQKDPLPQARIAFDAVYDDTGARHLLHEVRAGDTFVIRNLPPTLSTAIDRIRTFRLTRTELDLDAGVLTVEPEKPLPTLEAQIAGAL